MAVELTGLAVVNVAYLFVGAAAFVAGGWVSPADAATWKRLGAAYLFGIAVLVVPASYLALAGVPVGWSALVVGLTVVGLALRRVGLPKSIARPRPRWPSVGLLVGGAVTAVALVVLGYSFAVLVVRPLVEFDAWAIWAPKARLLYQDASAAPGALRSGQYGQAPYPLALPTLQALGFGAMGRFDGTLIGAQFGGLALGFVAAFWSLLESRARPIAIGLAVTAVVAAPQLLFQLLTHYADVPLGLFVGAGVAAAAAWTSLPDGDGWLLACGVAFLGMAGLTKSEGLMYAAAAAVALVVAQIGSGWQARMRPVLLSAAAIAAILVPWQLYCAAYGLRTGDYDLANVVNVGYLRAQSSRLGPVLSELGHQLANTRYWGLLVPAVVVAVATGLVAHRWRTTAFAVVWLASSFGGLVVIYWISTLPTSSNLTNSSFRTIVSLLVGGTALIPLLVAPAAHASEPRRRAEQEGPC